MATVVLVMCAGIVVGRLSVKPEQVANATGPTTTPPSRPGGRVNIGSLPDILQVNADQRKNMEAIWQNARDQIRKLQNDRRNLDSEHTQKIQDLLTTEQRVEYKKINDEYDAARKQLSTEQGRVMEDADNSTVKILDDKQRVKYDALRKQMPGNEVGREGGRGPRGMSRGSASRRSGTTKPSTRGS